MDVFAIAEWLENTAVGEVIRTSDFLFPLLESLHVLGVALVFGTILIVDARLMGWGSRGQPAAAVLKQSVRWTWIGFMTALVTGGLLFLSDATTYVFNAPFQIKMSLLLLAGINMIIFEAVLVRSIAQWDREVGIPWRIRLSGALSLTFWTSIVAFGRFIGFTKFPF